MMTLWSTNKNKMKIFWKGVIRSEVIKLCRNAERVWKRFTFLIKNVERKKKKTKHISHLTLWKILPDDNTNVFTVYFSQLYI